MIRKIIGRILSFITAAVLFFLILGLFSKQQSVSDTIELTYIFVDEEGNEYDLFSKQHGSATDWSFLFVDDGNSTPYVPNTGEDTDKTTTTIKTEQTIIYTGKDTTNDNQKNGSGIHEESVKSDTTKTTTPKKSTGSTASTGARVSTDTKASTGTTTITVVLADQQLIQQQLSGDLREQASGLKIPADLLQQDPEIVSLILRSQAIQTAENKERRLLGIADMTPEQVEELRTTLTRESDKLALLERKYGTNSGNTLPNVDYVGTNEEEHHTYKSCITPWNMVVQHGEYVLAYQQRTDVPDVCNVQKRVCRDGVLNGTYTQGYCNENVNYKYTKVQVKEYNNKGQSDLVQNPKHAKYDGAEYDKYGKVNGSGNTPTTIWDNQIKSGAIKQDTTVHLNEKTHLNCTAPRGDIVIHGQFVKAYASPLGFTDEGCKVELRLCLDGELQGNYAYSKCKYTNISYSDYMDGNKTIYDLYNEAYNIANTSSESTETENIYAGLDDIYGDAESLRTHNMTNTGTGDDMYDETTTGTTYIKKSFIRQIRDWLINVF